MLEKNKLYLLKGIRSIDRSEKTRDLVDSESCTRDKLNKEYKELLALEEIM